MLELGGFDCTTYLLGWIFGSFNASAHFFKLDFAGFGNKSFSWFMARFKISNMLK